MIRVEYITKVACPFTEKEVLQTATIASRHEKKIQGTVEVVVVGDKAIQDLNRRYRGKNKVTDVLSFAWEEDELAPSAMLGQVYISYPQIKRQAKSFECTPEEEFIRMLVHGLLHIVGYDHMTQKEADSMFPLQEKIVEKAKLKLSL